MSSLMAVLLVALSIGVTTVVLERGHFWWRWWQQRHQHQLRWEQLLAGDPHAADTWLEDRRWQMAWGEPLLQAGAVLAPLLGLIGTVLGLMQVLASLGPRLLLPAGASLQGYGQVLTSTAAGLLVALLATAALLANQALRQWQLQRLARQRRHSHRI